MDAHVAGALDVAVLDEGEDVAEATLEVVVCAWGKVEAGGVDEAEEDALAGPEDLDLALCEAGLGGGVGGTDEAGEAVEVGLGGVGGDGGGVEEETEEGGLARVGGAGDDEGVSGDDVGGGERGGTGASSWTDVHGWVKGRTGRGSQDGLLCGDERRAITPLGPMGCRASAPRRTRGPGGAHGPPIAECGRRAGMERVRRTAPRGPGARALPGWKGGSDPGCAISDQGAPGRGTRRFAAGGGRRSSAEGPRQGRARGHGGSARGGTCTA